MEYLSSNIRSIFCGSEMYLTLKEKQVSYAINRGGPDEVNLTMIVPFTRQESSSEIIESNDSFINGFKVVQTANKEYAYIREEDGVLLPYRYDIASDFNEYGFAMVAKGGNANWINSQFQYLSRDGKMEDEKLEDKHRRFQGFQEIQKFSQGQHPLSKIHDGRNSGATTTFYFSPEGKRQEFYPFDGGFNFLNPLFSIGNINFGNKGYIVSDKGILFANGFYCPLDYVIQFFEQRGLVSKLGEKVGKRFYKEKLPK